MNDKCKWVQWKKDIALYETSCGNDFYLHEGNLTPDDYDMKYCCFCGKELEQVMYEGEKDD